MQLGVWDKMMCGLSTRNYGAVVKDFREAPIQDVPGSNGRQDIARLVVPWMARLFTIERLGRPARSRTALVRPNMKILIAHDWPLIRAGIMQVLCDEFGPLEITQVSTVLEGFDLASGPWDDLAFVGVDTDNENLHFIAALKRAHPQQRGVGVSTRAKVAHFEGVLQDFIRDSINIKSTIAEIVAVVRRAIGGIAESPLKKNKGLPETPSLSKRELEVLRLIAAGKNIKEVAAVLNVSASTISTYRVRMLRKLKLTAQARSSATL